VDLAGFDIGVPTSFFVGAALNLTPKNPERELKVMRRKIKAGANFFLTQPVFDPPAAQSFIQYYQEKYGSLEVPILVGILPLYNERHARFLHNEVPGITIDKQVIDVLHEAGKKASKVGVQIAVDLITQMQSWVQGVYLMPAFNRYDLAADIVGVFHTPEDVGSFHNQL
jgi:homocysteine S-methyltransferase